MGASDQVPSQVGNSQVSTKGRSGGFITGHEQAATDIGRSWPRATKDKDSTESNKRRRLEDIAPPARSSNPAATDEWTIETSLLLRRVSGSKTCPGILSAMLDQRSECAD